MYLCKRKANKFRNLATLIFLNIAILGCSFSPVNSDSEIIVNKIKFDLSVPIKIKNNLKIIAAKLITLSASDAGGFYAEHKGKPFYDDLIEFMTSGPVFVQVLEGEDAISKNRELMGETLIHLKQILEQ